MMTDHEVTVAVATEMRRLVALGATQRQIYDALTRATNDVFALGANLPRGPIHQEI